MEKYIKPIFLLFIFACFFIYENVSALSWSDVSVRTAFFYENGTLSDSGFVSTNPRNLPQYHNTTTGAVSMRLFQWRYSSDSPLEKGRYKISTDITFSSLKGNDIVNFLNPTFDEFGCGTNQSDASPSNCTLVDYNTKEINDTKFQFNYTIDLLNDNCNFFNGIFKYYDQEYNNFTIVNLYGTENATLSYSTSFQKLASESNDDIIDNQNQNTQDIINNQNKNNEELKDTINSGLNNCHPSVNLLNFGSKTFVSGGITHTITNNSITSVGTSASDSSTIGNTSNFFTFNETLPAGTYTFSRTVINGYRLYIRMYDENKSTYEQAQIGANSKSVTFTLNSPKKYFYVFYAGWATGANINIKNVNLQLQKGSTATAYEPYGEEVCTSKLDDVTSGIGSINDSLTDSSPPDTSGLSNAAGWLPAGPADSLINLPIKLLQSLTNNLESSCTPINLPLPFVDSNLTIACPATILKKIDGFWMFWESFGLIAGVWVLYKYFINLYKWVESHLTMDEKESLGKWGGV